METAPLRHSRLRTSMSRTGPSGKPQPESSPPGRRRSSTTRSSLPDESLLTEESPVSHPPSTLVSHPPSPPVSHPSSPPVSLPATHCETRGAEENKIEYVCISCGITNRCSISSAAVSAGSHTAFQESDSEPWSKVVVQRLPSAGESSVPVTELRDKTMGPATELYEGTTSPVTLLHHAEAKDSSTELHSETKSLVTEMHGENKGLVEELHEESNDQMMELHGETKGPVTELDEEAVGSLMEHLSDWNFPIFDLVELTGGTCGSVLSRMAFQLFEDTGLFEIFKIPVAEFTRFFHALESGYHDVAYHNRVHAADVLHGVWYLATQPVPGLQRQLPPSQHGSCDSDSDSSITAGATTPPTTPPTTTSTTTTSRAGVGALLALFVAAAVHDYDHPGRSNSFLVETGDDRALLYNDRSVLENHHASASWRLLLSRPGLNFLAGLERSEFRRVRFLVLEAVLATDLQRHFHFLGDLDARLCIKMADVSGPTKIRTLHLRWTQSIASEFYAQVRRS
ncbi:uncharacterized protein LOC144947979 [Lampetra fluviatilis]